MICQVYPELDAVLADLVTSARAVLGDTYVGAYVQGSFALGAGDLNSDCDFVIATTVPPHGRAERELRHLHDDIPTRPGFWTKHLEGSYADTTSLRGTDGLGTPWLFCDHGHRELTWDTHCNTLHTRWILRNRGIIASLVDEVPPDALRAAMRTALPTVLADIRTWAPFDVAWTQRYIVATYCRTLYTLCTAMVTSKRGALEWARANLDPEWRPLLTQVMADRALGWDPTEPPRPGTMARTHEFATYAQSISPGGG